MSGLFGGAQKATQHATQAMGIDFQGAQYGPPVPVVYGRNKVSGNCIWYGDFKSHAQQQKSGKGGGGGSTTNYTYSASAQMGLCEGPGIVLNTVYNGTSVINLSSLNYTFASGAKGQAPWSHLSGSAALGYTLTAIFSFQNLALGSQASLPNYNYEVTGLKPFSGSIQDANPKDIATDVCSDPYHGINFPFLGDLTQYSNYCVANSLFLSPVYDQQQTANQVLSDLFNYTNAYVYYSDDQLKVVPLGDVAVTGNGVTYTPNVTPIVNLGTNDFLIDDSGPSITIDRKAPQDSLNLVRVEFTDRSNTYHDSAVVGAIDDDVVANGERSDDSETVNGCTTAAVARFIAQNLVQRAYYIRNTHQFKLSWRYCYLEPTDIVTLTDASLGLNLFPVRITEIQEDENSGLLITAEEFPEGIGHSAIYNTQPNGGTNVDQNADPGAVNPPYLFRGPGFLVNGSNPEIWCACNGSDPLWAGAEVHLSHDGSSYTYCGTIASQARYGDLTTLLPAGTADPDITNTPSVQLYAPAALLGGSQADADNFVTLAMVDTEVIAYETATLTGTETYQLSYLRRGGYGSANTLHGVGAPFVRLDDSIFRIPVDPSLIGSTVYLKFLSLNCFGRTPRTLADETAYTYVVGTNAELPDVPDAPASFAVAPVADGVSITWSNDNPAATGCTSIEYATASGGPFSSLAQVGPTTTGYHHAFTTGSTYYYRARARGPLLQSGWSAYTSTVSSTGVNVTGSGGVLATLATEVNTAQADADAANTQLAAIASDNILSPAEKPTVMRDYSVITTEQAGIDAQALNYLHAGSSQQTAYDNAISALTTYLGTLTTPVAWNNKSGNTTIVGATFRANFNAVCTARQTLLDAIYAQANALTQGGGDNLLFNPGFESNVVGSPNGSGRGPNVAVSDGWYVYQNAPGVDTYWFNGAAHTGAAGLFIRGTSGFSIPANSGFSVFSRVISRPMLVSGGDTLTIGGWCNAVTSSGLTILSRIGLYLHKTDGSTVEVTGNDLVGPSSGWASRAPFAYTVGSDVESVQLQCAFFIENATAAAITIPANSVYAQFDDLWVTRNDLRVAGSGTQIGDQRNLPPVNTTGGGAILTSSPLSFSISGTTVTFNCAAVGVQFGGPTVNYNVATPITKTQTAGTTQVWNLYYIDPTYSGGTQTLHASTSVSDLVSSAGVVNLGSCSVTVASGGGGSGGTGGGGGRCVADDMFIGEGRLAGDAQVGDSFDCIDLPTSAGKHVRALQGVTRGVEECVRMITSDGCALVCSVSTPFDLPEGCSTTAPHMLGEQVITDFGTATVISLALVGSRPVTRAHLGGVSYAAGADPARRIYSHNFGVQKP